VSTSSTKPSFKEPDEWKNAETLKAWMAHRAYCDKKPLPALESKVWDLDSQRQGVLLALYAEVCNGWRTLTDVRFKLLGLVPVVSVTIVIALLSRGPVGQGLTPIVKSAIAGFGLIITVAVLLYDLRNTELYNDLVGRGRQIEAELGIHTGHFRGRPKPTNKFIKHDIALGLIYTSSIVGWGLAALTPWL
jgi:hypothetical protein